MRIKYWAITAAIAVILTGGQSCWSQDNGQAADLPDRGQLQKEISKLNNQTKDFQQLFEKVSLYVLPSVVSVSTTHKVRVMQQPEMPFPFPFSPFGQPETPQPREREVPQTGLGSGFIYDAKGGWIVTNAHVVKDVQPEETTVTFYDGREVKALEIYSDPSTDVAVIRVPTNGLVQIEWTDEQVMPGQWVIAVGSPMGFGSSVTSGIVSAPSTAHRFFGRGGGGAGSLRANINPYAIEDYIQTDAAINPGNSGGPLVTLDGKVVGINTLIVSSTMSSAGLGFAVPERIARPVVEQLIKNKKVIRGWLGVSIANPADITDEAAWQLFQMRNSDEVFNTYRIKKDDKGALVAGVMPNAPAEKGGVEVGDLITEVDGQAVNGVDELRSLVAAISPDEEAQLTVQRLGRTQKLEVTVGEQPSGMTQLAGAGAISDLGMSVQTLTPELAQMLGYSADLQGVIVTDIDANGPAAAAGLQRNDIILQVGRTEVVAVEDFRRAIQRIPAEGVAFLVRRGDQNQFVTVKPSNPR